MSKCKVDYKGNKNLSDKDFNSYARSQAGLTPNANYSSQEISEKFQGVKSKIDTLKKDKNNTFLSVSKVVGNVIATNYGDDKSGIADFASKAGEHYHKIGENVILNLNAGKKNPFENIKFSSIYDKQWAQKVVKLYKDEFNPDGKNTVLPEVYVGKSDPKTTGVIDVMVITPEGKVRIYDYKAVLSEYSGNPKHNSQLQFYKRMLELGDITLGMPPVEVESANIIPIQLKAEKTDTKNFKVVGHDLSGTHPLNIETEKNIFPDNKMREAEARTYFQPDPDITFNFNKIKSKHQINFHAFNQGIIGFDQNTKQTKVASIAATIMQDEDSGKFYYTYNNKNHYFKHESAHRDTKQGHSQRMRELREEYGGRTMQAGSLTDDMIHMLTMTEYKPTTVRNPMAIKNIERFLDAQFKSAGNVRAIRADSLPGMEHVGDDIMIVYHNYDPETNKYSKADIIAVSSNEDEDLVEPYNDSKYSTTLAGMYLRDNQIEIQKNKLGLHQLNPLKRTKRNERLVRVGLVAMALRNADEDTIIGDTKALSINDSLTYKESSRDLNDLLDNIKLLTNLTHNSKPILDKSVFDAPTKAVLNNPNLYNASIYKQNQALSYYNLISNAMEGPEGAKTAKELKNDFERLTSKTTEKEFFAAMLEGDEETFRRNLKLIEQDNTKKLEAIRILGERQEQILEKFGNESGAAQRDPEYALLNSMIIQLHGLRNDLDIATDINLRQGWISSTGKTGIKLIDAYFDLAKARMRRVSMRYIEDYYPEKVSEFKKLFKSSANYSAIVNGTLGNHAKFYDDLLEFGEFAHVDDPTGPKTKRYTGRFWSEESSEFKNLSKPQQNFIRWYKTKTKEAFKNMLTEEEVKKFESLWGEDWIPAMKSDMSNQLFKAWFKGKGSDLSTLDAIKSGVARWRTSLEHYDEFINVSSDNKTKLTNFFKGQLATGIDVDNPETGHQGYGDKSRLKNYGLETGPDGNLYAIRDWKNMQETDLERIIDAHTINTIRQEELSPLLPLYNSIRSAIAIEEINRGSNFKFTNLNGMFEKWTEMVIQQKDQIMENRKLERGFRLTGMVSNTLALSWNLFSQVKNTIAGYGHTGVQSMIESLASKDPKRMKAYHKAYKKSWEAWLGHRRTDKKVNAIMMSLGMADTDAEALQNNLLYKVGGRNVKMGSNLLVQLQDYFHRSHMIVGEMEYDKSIDAYEQVTKDGETIWKYNEDLDPRFKGEEGAAFKKSVKKMMIEEGTISSLEDKMPIPYTHKELTKFKSKANDTFEAHNIEDQNQDQAYAVTRLAGSLRSWLKAKSNRWLQEGHVSEVEGRWVKHEDENGQLTFVWEGQYIEGIYHTTMSVFNQFAQLVQGGKLEDVAEHWNSMSMRQKENMYRFAIELALIGTLLAALRNLFDDEESFTYGLLTTAVNEVYMIEHLRGAGDVLTNPFPQIKIIGNTIRNLFSDDSERRLQSLGTIGAVGKIGRPFKDLGEDIGLT